MQLNTYRIRFLVKDISVSATSLRRASPLLVHEVRADPEWIEGHELLVRLVFIHSHGVLQGPDSDDCFPAVSHVHCQLLAFRLGSASLENGKD